MQTALSLTPDARSEVVEALNQSIAEVSICRALARGFSVNVTGMARRTLSELFATIADRHYGVDELRLANRVLALESHVEMTEASRLKRSKIAEHDGHAVDIEMIKTLCDAQLTLAETLAGTAAIAERHGDGVTQSVCCDIQEQCEFAAAELGGFLR
ncbi:MAG: DNA starvation/stationary phase protection protein [Pseudomonadota bacterium]